MHYQYGIGRFQPVLRNFDNSFTYDSTLLEQSSKSRRMPKWNLPTELANMSVK